MRNVNKILMVAVATVSMGASAQADQGSAYLGNRDDIVMIKPATDTMKQNVKTMTASAMKKVSEPVKTISMSNGSAAPSASVSPAAGVMPAMPAGRSAGDIPPNARPGECYAKVLIPARYETMTDRIKVSDEQRVLNRIIPAKYQTTTERVKIKDARKYWKAGHGPITKKNQVTGEILCLVEEPAEFKTIEKRVMVQPEQPEYKTVPARYETITKRNMIQSESWEWRRILCETNLNSASVMQIQRALGAKGYKVSVDGRLGGDTMGAINRYQLKNGLASRGITYETLNHLGISLTGA